jgi:hypothetical protein
MGRPWCELQVAGEQALGVNVAELRWRWLVMGYVIELLRWCGNMSVWCEWVDIVLMLPLNQRWLLCLLLLVKGVDGILQFC